MVSTLLLAGCWPPLSAIWGANCQEDLPQVSGDKRLTLLLCEVVAFESLGGHTQQEVAELLVLNRPSEDLLEGFGTHRQVPPRALP